MCQVGHQTLLTHSPAWAVDGCIMCCRIISQCQLVATSETVLLDMRLSCVSSNITSTRRLQLLYIHSAYFIVNTADLVHRSHRDNHSNYHSHSHSGSLQSHQNRQSCLRTDKVTLLQATMLLENTTIRAPRNTSSPNSFCCTSSSSCTTGTIT